MIYGVLFCIFSVVSGAVALSFLDKEKRFGIFSRLIFSLVLGTTLQGFVVLVCALVTKNLTLAAWATLGISLIVFLLSLRATRSNPLDYLRLPRSRWSLAMIATSISILLIAAVVLLLAYQSMIWVDGFPYGILKGWGDGAYHMDMIRVLAESDPFALNHPIAGGTPLTYTFFINFLSALILKLGSSFALAWHLPLFIYGAGIAEGLWHLVKLTVKKPVLQISFVAIVLFGGGLGLFIVHFSQPTTHYSLLTTQLEYTHMDIRTGGKPSGAEYDANIVWITPAISFFSHQRSFMPAAALAFLFLAGVFAYWKTDKVWLWFMLVGFIPLAHLHTVVAMGIFALVVFLFRVRDIQYTAYGIQALLPIFIGILIAAPQLYFLLSNSIFSSVSPLTLWFGWMTCAHNTNWFSCDPNSSGTDANALWFWFKNFGVLFGAWLLSFFFIKKIKKHSALFATWIAGSIIFAVGNLVKLQPWEFDNNKLLFYWWFAATLVFVFLIEKFIGRMPNIVYRTPDKITPISLAIIFILGALASGTADVFARISLGTSPRINKSHFGYYSQTQFGAAEYIRNNTPSTAVIVSASGANNFIPMLTGRPIYLGFEGWLWTQGRADTGSARRQNIRSFLQTGDPTVLCSNGATYLYWDEPFKQEYLPFIQKNFLSQTERVYEDEAGILYKLQCPHLIGMDE